MKITKERLKQIIQEEVERFQNEGRYSWYDDPRWSRKQERDWRRSTDEEDPQRRRDADAYAQGKEDAMAGRENNPEGFDWVYYDRGYKEGESVQKSRKERGD
jgi:hypothetical protein